MSSNSIVIPSEISFVFVVAEATPIHASIGLGEFKS